MGEEDIPGRKRKKERKQTSQGRDGRTARHHHTGHREVKLREGVEDVECRAL